MEREFEIQAGKISYLGDFTIVPNWVPILGYLKDVTYETGDNFESIRSTFSTLDKFGIQKMEIIKQITELKPGKLF